MNDTLIMDSYALLMDRNGFLVDPNSFSGSLDNLMMDSGIFATNIAKNTNTLLASRGPLLAGADTAPADCIPYRSATSNSLLKASSSDAAMPEVHVQWMPNIQAQTSGQVSKEDWDRHRQRIMDLYAKHDPKVMKIMLREANFRASKKSFRDHIAAWGGNSKHLNEEVVHAVIRKTKKREELGKVSVIKLGGRLVSPDEVSRYVGRRKKKYTSEYLAQLVQSRASTPERLIIFTSPHSPPPVLVVESFVGLELLLNSIKRLFLGSLRDDYKTIVDTDGYAWTKFSPEEEQVREQRWQRASCAIQITVPNSNVEDALKLEAELFYTVDLVKGFVKYADIRDLTYIIYHVWDSKLRSSSAVLDQVANYIENISGAVLGVEHPLTLIWRQIKKHVCNPDIIRHVLSQALRLLLDMFARLGELHSDTISAKSLYEKAFNDDRADEVLYFENLLTRCEARLGPYEPRTVEVLVNLGWTFCNMGQYTESETVFREVLSRAQHLDAWERGYLCMQAYWWIASCRRELGDREAAVEFMWKAIHVQVPNEANSVDIADMLDELRRWHVKWDDLEGAEELRPGIVTGRELAGFSEDFVKLVIADDAST